MVSLLALMCFWALTLQSPPSEAAKHFSRAVELQQGGRLDAAAEEYRTSIKLQPDYAEAHANLGVVLARLGRFDEAAASYETALRYKPELIPIHLNLGILYHRARQFDKAIASLTTFLNAAPNHMQARQLLGVALFEMGRDEEAIAQLEPVFAAGADDTAALYSLGLAYVRTDNKRQQDVINRLSSLPTGAAVARLLHGQAHLKRLEFEKAIAELRAAQALNPDLPKLNYSLGLCYINLGRNKEAIAAFEAELKQGTADATTRYHLATMYEVEGNIEAAHRNLTEALKLMPETPESNALLSKILIKQNRGAEALLPLEKAVAADPTDPTKRYSLARLYRQLGRQKDADREFAEVQRLKAEQLKKDRARTPQP
jgi:tetratricopeptide (TPR) repeat protein